MMNYMIGSIIINFRIIVWYVNRQIFSDLENIIIDAISYNIIIVITIIMICVEYALFVVIIS